MTEDREPNVETPHESGGEPHPVPRVFLVVVDETEEMTLALRYACRRARKTGGRVALLHVVEPVDFQISMTVADLMQEERRTEGEQLLQRLAKDVLAQTGKVPVLYLREGVRRDELLSLIEEDPTISQLVLASSTGSEGPGPLLAFLTAKGLNRLRVPLTIVPGTLTPEQIDAVT